MEELLKLIKANMKEGADIAAIETLAKGLDVLAGVKTVEEAKELIEKTGLLKSATDSLVSIAVQSHDDKFAKDKLPGLLKTEGDKIRAEINPKETPEQKKFREAEERIKVLEGNESRSNLKAALMTQATELGYTGNVDLFLSHGENAESMLKAEAKRYKTDFDSALSDRIKEQFPDAKPKTSTVDPAKSMKRSDFDLLNPYEQAALSKDVVITE